jgi:hypothetical protein
MKLTPFGVDIAKHAIQVHFIDEFTGEVVDKQIKRVSFLEFFSNKSDRDGSLRWFPVLGPPTGNVLLFLFNEPSLFHPVNAFVC